MFQQVSDSEISQVFAEIYNSAIRLFDEKDRADATGDIFLPQIQSDVNYLYRDGGAAKAFFSYRALSSRMYAFTSLYVKRDCQCMGIGQSCVLFLQEKLPKGSVLYTDVLNNAPWSIRFYQKMGFTDVAAEDEAAMAKHGIKSSPWSRILRKAI